MWIDGTVMFIESKNGQFVSTVTSVPTIYCYFFYILFPLFLMLYQLFVVFVIYLIRISILNSGFAFCHSSLWMKTFESKLWLAAFVMRYKIKIRKDTTWNLWWLFVLESWISCLIWIAKLNNSFNEFTQYIYGITSMFNVKQFQFIVKWNSRERKRQNETEIRIAFDALNLKVI